MRRLFRTALAYRNPNLFVRLVSSGFLWASTTNPWQETYPWTFNKGNI